MTTSNGTRSNARFANKVWLVTGAASGMGRATALQLVSPASEFVTGQILNVDGGILSHAAPFADIRRMAR